MWERMKDQPLGKNDSPQWEALLSKRTLHSTQSTHFLLVHKNKVTRARNWPVVGHRERNFKLGKELEVLLLSLIGETGTDQQHLCGTRQERKSVTIADTRAHVATQRGGSAPSRDPSSPWGPRLGSLHSGPASEKTWDAWSSPDTRRATRDTRNRGSASRGWCRGSAATSPSRSGSWWLGVDESTWSFLKKRDMKTWQPTRGNETDWEFTDWTPSLIILNSKSNYVLLITKEKVCWSWASGIFHPLATKLPTKTDALLHLPKSWEGTWTRLQGGLKWGIGHQ